MSNRGKLMAVTAGLSGAAIVAARRRAQSRRLSADTMETIVPAHVPASWADAQLGADGHAPGHTHLPMVDAEPEPDSLSDRPWTKNLHGMRHPFSDD